MPVTGWKLEEEERRLLLERFPPRWPDVLADHITLDAQARAQDPLPVARKAEIVGNISDGAGLEAMVVTIDGTTARPDGSSYHITWSIDRSRGRKPVESNQVIAVRGWHPLVKPIPIRIIPARFG